MASILPQAPEVWTCSMHPQIQQGESGQCPICGMDLIPVETESDASASERSLTMSEAALALADIQTSIVERAYPEAKVRLVGKLDYDETRVRSLAARFPARIDRLFVNFNGLKVQRGEHLAQVFSPELLTAMSDLLRAHRINPRSVATKAAKEKLRLWDLLPKQIEQIIEHDKAIEDFELLAPISGVVVQKNINEGEYVKTGQPLFKIVDMQHLWLKLEAYESDLAWLRFGQKASFTVEAFPGEIFEGHISFIEPELSRKTRTVSLRVNVPNDDGRLKPGMFARAQVNAQVAQNGMVYTPELMGKWISPMHPQIIKDGPGQCDICGMDLVPVEKMGISVDKKTQPPLVIPANAVLKTGKRAVVYIKSKQDKPIFEGREIILGPRTGEMYIVKSGLSAGEEIVTNGAFKIDSALQIQAKPSMMNTQVMNHEVHADLPLESSFAIPSQEIHRILPLYFDLQSALANDDLDEANNVLKQFNILKDLDGSLLSLINEMSKSESLDGLRNTHFSSLSNALISQIEKNSLVFDNPIYQMFCPMANGNEGASWLQLSSDLRNPYFGSMMLMCGELTKVFEVEGDASGVSEHAH